MRCFQWYLFVVLALAPRPSSAIQLHWSSGASDLSFESSSRCTLVVQADAEEGGLPKEWRLLWVAVSCEVSPVPLAPQATCQLDVAEITSVSNSMTATDIAANLVTARFCSAGDGVASTALFVLDLPGARRGGFNVVALDPTDPDSSRVIQSGVATFNGGLDAPFPPVILRASTVHQSTEFRLSMVGAGLDQTRELSLVAPDGSWRTPLTMDSQNETALTATAALAANVPECLVEAQAEGGVSASFTLPGEAEPPLLDSSGFGCVRRFAEILDPQDPYMIQPKDFAFVSGGWTPSGSWTFHLFYIRSNQRITARSGQAFTEKNLGHAVSNDLVNWTILDTAAVKVRAGMFDSKHVWAPTVVRRGVTYHMFYTGVDANDDQRIGHATSTDLVTWVQGGSVLEVTPTNPTQIPWADPAPPGYGSNAQLRDAFVMEDPNVPGNWLMYFVTVTRDYTPGMVVGMARSLGDLEVWQDAVPLWGSRHPYGGQRIESAHVFARQSKWWLFYTANGDTVYAVSNPTSPSDTVTANWAQAKKLVTLVPPAEAGLFYFWHATEYLEISAGNDIRYLAAFNDANVDISYTQLRAVTPPYLFSSDCPSATGADESAAMTGTPRLFLTGRRPAHSRVGLRIELPVRARARLAVYDVAGRQLKTLLDEDLPAGATEVAWDAHDAAGAPVGSGVYFASLTVGGNRHAVRVPLIR